MITISKIGYWKIAYFLAPVIATLLVEIFFSGWLIRSYGATLSENGIYALVLNAIDTGGSQVSDLVYVQIEGDMSWGSLP